MQAGEIYLARFPFGDIPGMKLRPVLLLTGTVGSVPEVLVAYISSVLPAQPLPSDLILDPTQPAFQTTNLKVREPAGGLSVPVLHRHVNTETNAVAAVNRGPFIRPVG